MITHSYMPCRVLHERAAIPACYVQGMAPCSTLDHDLLPTVWTLKPFCSVKPVLRLQAVTLWKALLFTHSVT